LQSTLSARLRHVDRIFKKNHGIVVSKSNRAAPAAHRRIGNGFRGSHILNPVEIAGFGDVPVLAELPGQLAPPAATSQDRSAWQEMVERFFLDRINTKSGRTSVSGEHDLLVLPSAHKAEPALAFVQLAIARTNIALDAPIRQSMPIAGWVSCNRLIHAAS